MAQEECTTYEITIRFDTDLDNIIRSTTPSLNYRQTFIVKYTNEYEIYDILKERLRRYVNPMFFYSPSTIQPEQLYMTSDKAEIHKKFINRLIFYTTARYNYDVNLYDLNESGFIDIDYDKFYGSDDFNLLLQNAFINNDRYEFVKAIDDESTYYKRLLYFNISQCIDIDKFEFSDDDGSYHMSKKQIKNYDSNKMFKGSLYIELAEITRN